MCGIFAYLGEDSQGFKIVVEGLKSLEYRGYDSWGVAVKKDDGRLYVEKHVGKIGKAKVRGIKSNIGFGHTRWATHGGVTKTNAHPHLGCNNKVAVIHNGIIENFESLRKELINKGHHFRSQTDTEVIAHLVEEYLKKETGSKEAVLKTFNRLAGLNAFIVFLVDKEEFLAVKNGSPLVFGKGKDKFLIASDAPALVPYTKRVYFLDDNQILVINREGYGVYGTDGRRKSFSFLRLKYEPEEVRLGDYPHFMIKEINEQPRILQSIVDNEKINITTLASKVKNAYGTYFIGCGTAYYACLAGTYLFSKIAKRHANASVSSEFSYLVDFLKSTSLVIALSQSGETIDTISSVIKAREKKAKIFAITNVLGSTLYRLADYKMLLNAGPEKCVLATKSFTAKIALLYMLAHTLNKSYGKGVKSLNQAIKEVRKLLQSKKIKELVLKLKNKEHIYILGRGSSYPTALESALKIKEVSYIHAEGFAGGELKHGVIALVEKGTPVIIYNPEDETYEDTLSSAYEVKARGGHLIGVSSKSNKVYDDFIKVENCGEATIIPNVVVAQLLAYYLALSKGYDPDKPRNLAKSVTVK